MFQKYLRLWLAAAGVLLLTATISHAQTTAYVDPLYAGNQLFQGNLGLDFTVHHFSRSLRPTPSRGGKRVTG
jgi:hypothetical protein